MISPEKIEAMQGGWVRLFAECGASPAEVYPLFDELVTKYTEPHRHYHTLEHLADMFRVAGRLATAENNMVAIQLAIWFHDAIYDPKAHDNEAQSATWFREAMKPFRWPEATINQATMLIIATAHTASPPDDADAKVLLDADLAILSADAWKYQRYQAAIRQEYAWVEDTAYRIGRTKVLQQFLARERIYQTPRFYDMGEQLARQNLQAEIDTLTTSTTSPTPT